LTGETPAAGRFGLSGPMTKSDSRAFPTRATTVAGSILYLADLVIAVSSQGNAAVVG
jgi:hypothetical protein